MDSVTGRWVRRGDVIILFGPGPSATTVDSELSSGFRFSLPNFPAKPAAATGSLSLPISLFPPKPADPLVTDPKMQMALTNAVNKLEKARKLKLGTFPVRFTLVDVTNGSGSFPSAGYFETVVDYNASEAKVAVMYSAYALRDMVRRFAAATGANSGNLFVQLAKQMDPAIIKASPKIALSLLMDGHRVPSYKDVFALTPSTWGHRVTASFSPVFDQALEGMMVPSNNVKAGTCIRGIGYGYLNGALAAGGFFDPSIDRGLWVGGDYQQGKIWPYIRVVSRNDAWVAQAGTTRDMAKLVSLMMTDQLLDPASCAEMRGRLARAVRGPDPPFVARVGVFRPGTITHNKIGFGPLKSGKPVLSEVGLYQSPVKSGRRYVIAWQNLVGNSRSGVVDVAKVIKDTITEFER